MKKNNQIDNDKPVEFAPNDDFNISRDRMDRFTSDASHFEIVSMPPKKKAKANGSKSK